MNSTATVRLIAGREVRERLEGRLLRVMTALTALLVVAGVVIPALVHAHHMTRVGLVGRPAQAVATPLARAANAAKLSVRLVNVADDATAKALLRSGRLGVTLSVTGSGAVIRANKSVPAGVAGVVSTALEDVHVRGSLARAGVPPKTVTSVLTPVRVDTALLQPPRSHQAARNLAALASALIMYISLVLYGAAVAQGVAQEKTTRTAEILLAAVRPGELLAGKVIGIGVVGLGQLAVAGAAGLIANAAVHSAQVPGVIWVLIPAFLAYFLAGFVLYAFLYAVAGSLVARQEEVQFVTMPFSILLVAGYLLVYAVIGSPDATWLRVLSFVPVMTPTLAPALIAVAHVTAWEIAGQALALLIAILLTIRMAGRVYARALVRGGPRISWRTALRT